MKTIGQLIAEHPLGTVLNTATELPEASAVTKIMLGKTFRCVGVTQIIECEDGSILTLKGYAPNYCPEDNEEKEEV